MNNKIVVVAGFLVLLLALVGGGYFFYQASLHQQAATQTNPSVPPTPSIPTTPPSNQIKLTVTSPLPSSEVSTSQISVKGQTAPLADVAVGDTEVKADAAGNFAVTVNLEEGENPIFIVVSDANGNYTEQEITVTYVK